MLLLYTDHNANVLSFVFTSNDSGRYEVNVYSLSHKQKLMGRHPVVVESAGDLIGFLVVTMVNQVLAPIVLLYCLVCTHLGGFITQCLYYTLSHLVVVSIASLPFSVYRRRDFTVQELPSHPPWMHAVNC